MRKQIGRPIKPPTCSELAHASLTVQVTRKAIRNVYIRIDSITGAVRVTAPHSASDAQIRMVVDSHATWIARKLTVSPAALPRPNRTLLDGQTISLLGVSYRVQIEHRPGRTIICASEGTLMVRAPASIAPEGLQRAFDRWLDELMREQIRAIVSIYEPSMGVHAGEIAVRQMRSRWGSCKIQTGRIFLNRELVWLHPRFLEYVVVHELCHLLERGHNARFYQLMTRFYPDWQAARRELRVIGISGR